jgi:hypothetical protein
MQEVKNFSSGVLSNGGAIQRVQDREAKRERERLEKEAYEKHAAESAARRNKAREDRAIELAEQFKARQAAEEEKQRKAAEKFARDEEERLKGVAAKEAARLARQQDLERRLAENRAIEEEKQRKAAEKVARDEEERLRGAAEKEAARLARQQDLERRLAEKKEKEVAAQAAAEVAALLAKQQEQERQNQKQTQAAALLDDLSKAPETPKPEAPKPALIAKELEDPEEPEELEAEEPALQIVKGEVHVPASMPAMDASAGTETELPAAYDMSALMPAPAVLTVEAAPQPEVQVESGKELIDRILSGTEQSPENQEQAPQSARSENRFQKIINANRDLAKENQTLKAKVEKLLDEVHGYQVEGELVGSILDTQERAKRQAPPKNLLERHLKPDLFNVVNEAKQEILNYLSTREDEVDHSFKSALFVKYMQDPFYMNMFVQNNEISRWWATIDSIYNSIEMPPPDWSKVKITQYKEKSEHRPQPIRARTATLGAPVASSEQPMDRIAQHLGNMGI